MPPGHPADDAPAPSDESAQYATSTPATAARREFGELLDQSSAARDYDPLCVLDESNDMEAFAALPECLTCEGTGKQVPPGFWGEPDEPDDDLVEQVAQGWRTREAAAVLAAERGYTLEPWERCRESTQDWYRRQTRFVLAALRGGSGGSSAGPGAT